MALLNIKFHQNRPRGSKVMAIFFKSRTMAGGGAPPGPPGAGMSGRTKDLPADGPGPPRALLYTRAGQLKKIEASPDLRNSYILRHLSE